MQRIIDRLLIVALTAVLAAPVMGHKIIYTILFGIIYCGFGYSFFESRFHIIMCAAAGAVAVADGLFAPFLFFMLYEACEKLWSGDRREIIIWGGYAFIGAALCAVLPDRSLAAVLAGHPVSAALIALTAAMCVYLSYTGEGNMRLERRNFQIRDEGEEKKRLLELKNELMRRNRDNEIEMATLNERNRIAREIHDNVGHLLSRSILQVGALQTVCREEPFASSLKQVGETLGESMDNIRRSVHRLHSESIDLKRALEEIIAANGDCEASLDYDVSPALPHGIKYAVLSIVTEAFENVRRHSDGTRVWITVMEHPAFYQFIFRDNGHPNGISESGIGLHNMRSRIEELGGRISFDIKNGFRIFANIPKGH
ncbi:MAG: histidine kinase [Butyrivibrio sp.]|nr:histidine kinase [Butyrivibrio sp.]